MFQTTNSLTIALFVTGLFLLANGLAPINASADTLNENFEHYTVGQSFVAQNGKWFKSRGMTESIVQDSESGNGTKVLKAVNVNGGFDAVQTKDITFDDLSGTVYVGADVMIPANSDYGAVAFLHTGAPKGPEYFFVRIRNSGHNGFVVAGNGAVVNSDGQPVAPVAGVWYRIRATLHIDPKSDDHKVSTFDLKITNLKSGDVVGTLTGDIKGNPTSIDKVLLYSVGKKSTCLFDNVFYRNQKNTAPKQTGAKGLLQLTRAAATSYSIVWSPSESIPSEHTAAKQLKKYLTKISGAAFDVLPVGKASGKKIIVGPNKLSWDYLGKKTVESLGKEEFIIQSAPNGNLYIVGGRPRGTLYGVYYFLDRILGVKWLTWDFTYVPKIEQITLPPLNIHQKPAFRSRQVIYRRSPYTKIPKASWKWKVHNLVNRARGQSVTPIPEKYGGQFKYAPMRHSDMVHTFSSLIPAKKYFDKHPNWFALRNGKRQNDGRSSAMNLTSRGLIDEMARQAIEQLNKAPDSDIISISQNDFVAGPSQGANSQKLIQRYGAPSGLLLHFVNQVAGQIHKVYPDVIVETLAYQFTYDPPVGIKPADNVMVRLCIWAAVRSVPYADPKNPSDVVQDKLAPWAKITRHFGIWDYTGNFANSFVPDPDFSVLIPNLRTYKKYNVEHVFFGAVGSGSLMRRWILARAMWNPYEVNTRQAMSTFFSLYYGKKAGQYIKRYWQMLHRMNRQAGYLGLRMGDTSGAPSNSLEAMVKADALFQKALAAASEDKVYLKHVQRAYMPVQYMFLSKWNTYQQKAEESGIDMPHSFNEYYKSFKHKMKTYDHIQVRGPALKTQLKKFKTLHDRGILATASDSYGSSPRNAFDHNVHTRWNGGGFKGWVQVKFPRPRKIATIRTNYRGYASIQYKIKGSLDGKHWFMLVPERVAKVPEDVKTRQPFWIVDKLLKPRKVQFVRTYLLKVLKLRTFKKGWVTLSEQRFNAPDDKQMP